MKAHLAGGGHSAPEGGTGEAVTEQSGSHFDLCWRQRKQIDKYFGLTDL